MDSENTKFERVVILGAGPTGLGVSLGLILNNSTVAVTVIEKNNQVGGLSGSFAWKNHSCDYGPHRLSPNIETIRVLTQELLGPECLHQRSQHGVQIKNKLYQFPPRIIDWLNPRSALELLLYGFSFFVAKLVWVTKRFQGETFSELIIHRFGKRFFKEIVAPMTEKVWMAPDEIDPSFVTQRFSQIHPLSILKKIVIPKQDLNPAHFLYPRQGFQQLWDSARDFSLNNNHHFLMNTYPERILVSKNTVTEIFLKGAQSKTLDISRSKLVSTIPITVFIDSLDVSESSLDIAKLRALTRRLKFRSMILACFEFSIPDLLPFRTQIYPEQKYLFNRLFEQNKYSRSTVEEGKSVVIADITYPLGGWADGRSDEELIHAVTENLKLLRYIPLEKLSDTQIRRVKYAYVVPDREGKKAMHEIHHRLKSLTNVMFAGRFSVGEYDNSDYALMHGINLSSFLSDRISRLDYLKRIHLQVNPIVG